MITIIARQNTMSKNELHISKIVLRNVPILLSCMSSSRWFSTAGSAPVPELAPCKVLRSPSTFCSHLSLFLFCVSAYDGGPFPLIRMYSPPTDIPSTASPWLSASVAPYYLCTAQSDMSGNVRFPLVTNWALESL